MSTYKYLILLYFFLACGAAQARTYPAEPVRLLVSVAPGGGADRVGLVVHSLLTVKNVKALSARASADMANCLSQEIQRIVQSAQIKERLAAQGLEAVGSTPREYDAHNRAELTKDARIVKSAGIKIE